MRRLSATVVRTSADRWAHSSGSARRQNRRLPHRRCGRTDREPQRRVFGRPVAARVRVSVPSGNAVPEEPDGATISVRGNPRGQFDELTCISDAFHSDVGRAVGSERCYASGRRPKSTTTAHPALAPGVVVNFRSRRREPPVVRAACASRTLSITPTRCWARRLASARSGRFAGAVREGARPVPAAGGSAWSGRGAGGGAVGGFAGALVGGGCAQRPSADDPTG